MTCLDKALSDPTVGGGSAWLDPATGRHKYALTASGGTFDALFGRNPATEILLGISTY